MRVSRVGRPWQASSAVLNAALASLSRSRPSRSRRAFSSSSWSASSGLPAGGKMLIGGDAADEHCGENESDA
jgi:hypothetical protein